MKTFSKLYELAASRKGGEMALEALISRYFLREMGRDSVILSRDVAAALHREKAFTVA